MFVKCRISADLNRLGTANTEKYLEELLNTTNDCDSNPDDGKENTQTTYVVESFPQDSSSRIEIQAESSITGKPEIVE